MKSNKETTRDRRAPQVLTTFRHPMEAAHLANHLIENGIEARTSGTSIATGAIEFAQIDVEVLVPAEQLEMARRIATDFQSNEAEIDWSLVDWQDNDAEEQTAANFKETETDINDNNSMEATVGQWFYPTDQQRVSRWFLSCLVIWLLVWAAFTLLGTR